MQVTMKDVFRVLAEMKNLDAERYSPYMLFCSNIIRLMEVLSPRERYEVFAKMSRIHPGCAKRIYEAYKDDVQAFIEKELRLRREHRGRRP